jgi:hypothetical protein
MRRTATTLGWLLAVLVMASACGGSAPTEGARYQQIVNPANASWATFVTQARGWPGGAIPASGTALTQDVVQTWEGVNRQLLARHWPGPAQRDIATLVRSDTGVCQALERLPAQGAAAMWWTSLTATFSAEQAAAGRVRRDLHLPTAPGPDGTGVPPVS